MAYGTTNPRLSSSPSIVWVVAQRMMKSIFSPPMLGSIFVPYFFIFLGLSTGDVTYSDLALISARLAPCWASALFVGSFLYWLIRLPDSQKATPVPKLTRNELDYLKKFSRKDSLRCLFTLIKWARYTGLTEVI